MPIEKETGGDELVHVFPVYGREHVMSRDCWCYPERDLDEPALIIHNVEQ
jgi:hypothetical protein